MINSALKNKQIDLGRELTDEDVLAVIKTMVKQGKDALADFQSAGRDDLIAKQKEEIEYLETFLPEQMSDEVLEGLVISAIRELEASEPSDMGKVMGLVMKNAQGRADGNRVREIVQKHLAK